jgi:hypothetical protein
MGSVKHSGPTPGITSRTASSDRGHELPTISRCLHIYLHLLPPNPSTTSPPTASIVRSPSYHAGPSPHRRGRPPTHPERRERVLPLPVQGHLLLPLAPRILASLRSAADPVVRNLAGYPRTSVYLHIRAASLVPPYLPWPDSMVQRRVPRPWRRSDLSCSIVRSVHGRRDTGQCF